MSVCRSGGTVSLELEALEGVKRGTDRTAAELAIRRLTEELRTASHLHRSTKESIEALAERHRAQVDNISSVPFIVIVTLAVGAMWWLIVVVVLGVIRSSFSTSNSLIALAWAGLGVLIVGSMQYVQRERQLNGTTKHAAEMKSLNDAEVRVAAEVAQLEKRLAENRAIANG
ncbi:MAG: hypothetical protein M3P06_16260 [Acidobacteriota bacterium]|nr:hypothetical protein [Acidobacteriota bacterium]